MGKNKDYKDGMRFLLRECKNQNIEIRHLSWIPKFCKILSEDDCCLKFWENTLLQNNFKRIPLCEKPYDLFHTNGRYLFVWNKTNEGYSFWENFKHKHFVADSCSTFEKFNEYEYFNKIW